MTLFRHRVTGTFGGGDEWSFGLYSEGALSTPAAQNAWVAGLTAFWSVELAARISTDVSMADASTATIDETTGRQLTRVEEQVAHVGTNAGASLPYQVASVISLRTNLATRAGRGRMYAAPLAVSETAASRLTSAAQADLADSAAALMVSLTSAGLTPVIFHRSASSGVPAFSTTPIVSLDVGDVFDTQRRRRNKLIETRVSRPV